MWFKREMVFFIGFIILATILTYLKLVVFSKEIAMRVIKEDNIKYGFSNTSLKSLFLCGFYYGTKLYMENFQSHHF